MRKKRRELHLWHLWKSGTFQVVHVPEGVIVDYRVAEVHAPFASTLRGQRRVVFDAGYRWVYFTPRGEDHSLIVALDAVSLPQQLYVDICDGHGLDGDGQPFIHDMYLDVLSWITVRPDGSWRLGEPEIIDVDELEEGLAVGEVTPQQHAAAWAEARKVGALLRAGHLPALEVVRRYLHPSYT